MVMIESNHKKCKCKPVGNGCHAGNTAIKTTNHTTDRHYKIVRPWKERADRPSGSHLLATCVQQDASIMSNMERWMAQRLDNEPWNIVEGFRFQILGTSSPVKETNAVAAAEDDVQSNKGVWGSTT